MILGIPSCDLVGLGLLDEIYLDKDFIDPYYASKRENTLLIGTDCHNTQEHCHCISYDVNPYPEKHHDIALSVIEGEVFLLIGSDKGAAFIEEINSKAPLKDIGEMIPGTVEEARKNTQAKLKKDNKILPDYRKTGDLINKAGEEIWKNHSEDCVSCGACSAICPTCTCFLLVDRSGFEKIRQLDTCQYPGFERVAAGEDPLSNKSSRFRNRYMCKYVWRPQKFFSLACTGCGRCIEACIGRISKNELIIELSSKT
jgi:ferredoxin